MKFIACVFSLLLTLILVSCNSRTEEAKTENIEIKNADTTRAMHTELPTLNRDSIVNILQGKWKETEYPFRLAHFKNNTVKFIEEGVADEPTFKAYNISQQCPYRVDNIKKERVGEMFLVIAAAGTCEILTISNDTLTLSGFNVSAKSNYKIFYKKIK